MFRVNTLQKELTGDELFAAVMTSHAAHIPTHQMITDLNVKVTLSLLTRRLTTTPTQTVPKSVPTHRPDSVNEICRLFGQGKCQ